MKQKTRGQQLGRLTHQCCQNVITVLHGCALVCARVCVVTYWLSIWSRWSSLPKVPWKPLETERVALMLCCIPVNIQYNWCSY